ncbi:MAG: 3-dehydroquinate synthase [Bacteroidota bacterium]
MKKIDIKTQSGNSLIYIGESFNKIKKYLPVGKKICIITDKNVYSIYHSNFPKSEVIVIEQGESVKNLDTLNEIFHQLLNIQVDKSWFILGVGGGVICDIVGFAATTYMRGVSFGLVPTTLLAQADAAIGGKNGINFLEYKNIIGTINQPDFVLCDTDFIKTLHQKDINSGFAEIIKYAFIADKKLFNILDAEIKVSILAKKELVEKLIETSVEIKKYFVENDEKDTGKRNALNFGHTIGHAIEKISKYSHGEAVSIGMALAANFSVKKLLLKENEKNKCITILQKYDLPVNCLINMTEVLDAIKKDKKRNSDKINYVFLDKIGSVKLVKIDFNELKDFLMTISL